VKIRLTRAWYGLCKQAAAMRTAFSRLPRRARVELLLSAVLALGIFTILLVPRPREIQNFGSAASNLFTLVEGDYINPLLSSAKEVTVLNCAAEKVARFAGYDDFSTRIDINEKPYVANITRYNGNLLALLNIRFRLVEPVPSREPVLYISESFWDRVFARNEQILGTIVKLHNTAYRIAGVTSESSGMLANTDIWLPISGRGPIASSSSMRMVGALQPGTDWATAQSHLVTCFREFLKDHSYSHAPGARLLPVETSISFRDSAPSIASACSIKGGRLKT
jgi:hypothetical protein